MHSVVSSDQKIKFEMDQNFKFGYNGNQHNLRQHQSDVFQCWYSKSIRTPSSFRDECINVCKIINNYSKTVNKLPYVLLSGGADSEVVVRAFLELGQPFKVITNRFDKNLNSHEIEVVEKLSKELNFEVIYVDIDVLTWLGSPESLRMAEQGKCFQAEMLPTMKLMDHVYFNLNGIPVLGNGDFYANRLDGEWKYVEYEYILSWCRYAIANNMTAAINFFQMTPEIVLSVGCDPIMLELFQSPPSETINSRYAKYRIYQKNWNIEIREKYHGCELIQDCCDQIQQKFLSAYKPYTDKWKMPVGEFLKRLSK